MGQKNTTTRLQRLDQLTSLLKSSNHNLVSDLAKNLCVSPRTIMRDLDVLREKGYPIETNQGRGGGIRLHRLWGLGRLHLNYREIIDMLLSLAIMEKLHSPIFLANSKSIRNKISASFPQEQRDRIQVLRKRILIGEIASQTLLNDFEVRKNPPANALYEAFFEMKNINIIYKDGKENTTRRKIEPHYLFLSWPIWYVMAWDHLREDWRCFRLDRINNAKIEETSFKLKPSKQLKEVIEKFAATL